MATADTSDQSCEDGRRIIWNGALLAAYRFALAGYSPYRPLSETRFRGLVAILKCRLRVGSNLFVLGPPTTDRAAFQAALSF